MKKQTKAKAKELSPTVTYSAEMIKMNPVIGGVIGAVAGAAIGSVTFAALNDKSTRKQVLEQLEYLKKHALKAFQEAQEK